MCDPMFSRFSRTPTCDRQTDGHRTADASHRPVKRLSRALREPGHHTANRRIKCTIQSTFLHATMPHIHRFNKIRQQTFSKPFLIWLLTIPPHLTYVTTALRNSSLIAALVYDSHFLTSVFHNVVQRRIWGAVGPLIKTLPQIYWRI